MSTRVFAITLLGLITNVWAIWAVMTPILPTTYHTYFLARPRAAGAFPAPGRSGRVQVRGLDRTMMGCFKYQPGGILGVRNPTIREAVAADSAVADFLAQALRHSGQHEIDTLLAGMRNDARQVIGIQRFEQGWGYLINGYEPDPLEAGGLVSACGDGRWRWSIEYSPGAGFHHYSLFRDTCEDPRSPS